MNQDQTLKLQSYLDGELSSREADQVTEWLATDNEAQALFAELENTKTALVGNELAVKLPESRDFYFSKIKRQIEMEAKQTQRTPVRQPLLARLGKYLLPLTGAAAAAFAFVFMFNPNATTTAYIPGEVESSDSMEAHVFHSQSEHMTVVWLESTESQSTEEDSDQF